METYDRIVIGLGGVGSAALYHLAKRGVRALGIEQFGIGHDRGSSHGQTRIMRQAYFEHPDYVPLLGRADDLWIELEEASGVRLFDRVGLVQFGPADGVIIPGIERSVDAHGLPIERLSASESERRFPGYVVPPDQKVIFEPTAGILHVERCVETHVRMAEQAGAHLTTDTRVDRIEEFGGSVTVHTNKGAYAAEEIVICGGPWSPALQLQELPLKVVRKHLHWFASANADLTIDRRCPAFFYERPDGYFYGFPAYDDLGVKVAEHSGLNDTSDPSAVDPTPDVSDDSRVRAFLSECLPSVSGQRRAHAVCLYTVTPDEHFIVDRHPRFKRAVFAAGLSGHGFKFTPVLGEILAELSLSNQTRWFIDFLRHHRFAR